MCSFEVCYVGVAHKMSKWEGGQNGHFCKISPPTNDLLFELHQHDIPQKNTFLMVIKDLKNQFIV